MYSVLVRYFTVAESRFRVADIRFNAKPRDRFAEGEKISGIGPGVPWRCTPVFVGQEPTTISTYFFQEFFQDRDRAVLFFLRVCFYYPPVLFLFLCIPGSSWCECPESWKVGTSRKQRQGGGAFGYFRLSPLSSRAGSPSRFHYHGVVSRPTDTPFCTHRLGGPARAVSRVQRTPRITTSTLPGFPLICQLRARTCSHEIPRVVSRSFPHDRTVYGTIVRPRTRETRILKLP